MPAEPLDLLAQRNARREDSGPQHVNARCAPLDPQPEQEPASDATPADPLDALIQDAPASDATPADPDHNATGETMYDFLSGLAGDGDTEE